MPHQMPLPGIDLPVPVAPPVTPTADKAALRDYPHVPSDVLCHHAKQIGGAGEALFDSLVMRHGLDSLAMPESAAFDRMLLVGDQSVRVQIKTSSVLDGRAYAFTMSKGYRGSPQGVRSYAVGDYDLAACVILPANAVWVTAEKREGYRVDVTAIPGLVADPFASLRRALADLGHAPERGPRACDA